MNASTASCSLFSVAYCDGKISGRVLADSAANSNILPMSMAKKIEDCEDRSKISVWEFGIAKHSCERIICGMVMQADVEICSRHSEKLMLRRVEWVITNDELSNRYIGRHLLSALGIDNQMLLSAARDSFGASINVPEVTREQKKGVNRKKIRSASINEILAETKLSRGFTFHSDISNDDEEIERSDVYIDLDKDTEEELGETLNNLVCNAKRSGPSDKGVVQLQDLLKKHRKLFRV